MRGGGGGLVDHDGHRDHLAAQLPVVLRHLPCTAAPSSGSTARVMKFLLASVAQLVRQGLRINSVMIEDAAKSPAACPAAQAPGAGADRYPTKGQQGLARSCRGSSGRSGPGVLSARRTP